MTSSRVAELKTALASVLKDIDAGMENGIKVDGSNVEVSAESRDKIKADFARAKEIKELIDIETFGVEVKQWGEKAQGGSTAVGAGAFEAGFKAAAQRKTLGEAFVESDIFQAFKKSGLGTMQQPFELDAFDLSGASQEQKDVYTGLLTGAVNTRGFGRVQFDPSVPRGQRANRVRDLFPVATTNANLIDFFRVMGFVENGGDGNAGTVPERDAGNVFGLKPKSSLNFQSAQAPVRTIAHWEAAHRNVLQDEPQLQSTINNELLYGLALEEDDQILNGNGVGENLLGVLNTPGIQTYTQLAAPETKADALRKAATKSILANYPSTGYVVHPNDWEDIELSKDTQGRYILVSNVAIGAEARVWRQPVVETPAIPELTFLSGAFGLGAQLYDRQAANIRIAEQHADFFVRNAVVILAEERIALAVKRPESFVKGTFLA